MTETGSVALPDWAAGPSRSSVAGPLTARDVSARAGRDALADTDGEAPT